MNKIVIGTTQPNPLNKAVYALEDIEVTVEDPSGTDITNQVLDTDAILENGDDSVGLDLQSEDAGDYTVIFEGTDDLDYGDVETKVVTADSAPDEYTTAVVVANLPAGEVASSNHVVTPSRLPPAVRLEMSLQCPCAAPRYFSGTSGVWGLHKQLSFRPD